MCVWGGGGGGTAGCLTSVCTYPDLSKKQTNT